MSSSVNRSSFSEKSSSLSSSPSVSSLAAIELLLDGCDPDVSEQLLVTYKQSFLETNTELSTTAHAVSKAEAHSTLSESVFVRTFAHILHRKVVKNSCLVEVRAADPAHLAGSLCSTV